MNLLPAKMMPYAKAWVGLLAAVLVTVATTWEAAPEWVAIAAAVVGAVGVYLTPNKGYEPRHDPNARA